MLLKEVAYEEALLKVRVEVVLDLLGSSYLYPISRCTWSTLLIDEAYWVRVTLPDTIYVLQVAAGDEQLHLVAQLAFHGYRLRRQCLCSHEGWGCRWLLLIDHLLRLAIVVGLLLLDQQRLLILRIH